MTPGADPLVAPWREEHDWAAHHGIAAHVTVRSPFFDSSDWPGVNRPELAALVPVDVVLGRLEDRPGALVILAEPDDELRRLTEAVDRVCPGLPPHKAGFGRPVYHVTVVRTPDSGLEHTVLA